MPTSIVKQGDIWIIRGDTRPIRDVLSAAGAVWQPQRVRWEYTGESIPEAIQAALDGRRVLPIVEPVELSPVGEPEWDKLANVLIEVRDVLRGEPTLEETTAWVKAVNAEARRLDAQWDANIARKNAQAIAHGLPVEAGGVLLNAVQRSDNDAFVQLASGGTVQSLQELVVNTTTPPDHVRFYSVVVPKKAETRKKLLKTLIDADAVGIAQYNTSATRWSILWSTGVVEIMDVEELELASEERSARMLPAVEGATVLYANKRTANRGTLKRLKPSGKWEIEFEGGSVASEYDKGLIVLAHPVKQLYTVKEIRVIGVQAWNVVNLAGDVVIDELADRKEALELIRILNEHGIEELAHAKLVAEAWNVKQVKPNGDVMDVMWKKTLGTVKDLQALKAVLHILDTPPESWWIDEDGSIFRDDDPVPEHFAVLRGPFSSRAAAERVQA